MAELNDREFTRRFADCTLDPETFDHTAHVRLAWVYLRTYPEEAAVEHLCTQIAAYDRRHGDGTKFHKTLTVAAAYIVLHHIRKSKARTFSEFVEEFPLLITAFSTFVLAHYSSVRLKSPEAKVNFVPPDLQPFY